MAGEDMKISWPKIALLASLCGALAFEAWHFRATKISAGQSQGPLTRKNKPDFALLPATETAEFARRFVESGVQVKSWEPTVADMNDAESSLSQISALSSKNPGDQINHPEQYFRQYLAVSIDGKKRLFLNAFCTSRGDGYWRTHLVFVYDGGNCFWHATYDPSTQKFSELRVNGRA